MNEKLALKKINVQTIDRYNVRFGKFGEDAMTLGWDSRKSQNERFKAATQLFDFRNKEIYDIGCGFADFYGYLLNKKIRPKSYVGIDINKNLIGVAKNKYPQCRFMIRDILLEPFKKEVCDCAVMFGVLNFRLRTFGNYNYAKRIITTAFNIVKEALVVDMLSLYRDKGYPKEDFVFYYSPEKIFRFAQTTTKDVILKHDYSPIPQKEFMLCLRK